MSQQAERLKQEEARAAAERRAAALSLMAEVMPAMQGSSQHDAVQWLCACKEQPMQDSMEEFRLSSLSVCLSESLDRLFQQTQSAVGQLCHTIGRLYTGFCANKSFPSPMAKG
jgi:hypothetical protein